MEIKYIWVLVLGLVAGGILIAARIRRKTGFQGGKKVSGTQYLEEDAYVKKKLRQYRMLSIVFEGASVLAILLCIVWLAKPIKVSKVQEEKYNRDIILCMDISTSVDELNMQLVDNLEATVRELKGERFGIVIFNSSPVVLVPLTTDYDYIISELEMVKKCLQDRAKEDYDLGDEEWLYNTNYLMEGTLVGNEQNGSSLIGDGLASTVLDFTETDEKRTKIVLFSTDNDLAGTPLYTIQEAGELCKKNDITVYGIGTNAMLDDDKESMKKAVEITGGNMFVQEESGTVKEIVKKIEKQEASLYKSAAKIKEVPMEEGPFILLLLSVSCMLLCGKVMKRS